MMRTALASAAAMAVLLTAGAASAQDTPVIAWNLGVTSDYVFRGYTQTSEDAAIFGGVDVTAGDFYAGAWASNVDFGDDTDVEVDLYGGYRTEVSGFAVDVGVVGYLYTSQPAGADYDYVELKAAASRAIGPLTLGAALYWSPDFFGADEEATYVEANAAFSPAAQWTVSGAIGHQSLDVNADYATWNAGVAYALTDNVVVDLRYHDTDVDGPLSDDRVVGALKFLF
jgi:uncharacterized protein (TIGR02001 family)